jgi:hypothetical protein
MRSRPATDPTSWTYQAAMHGTYATPPSGALWNQCQHGTWYFLPWHRMYLYWFERIVRKAAVAAGAPDDWALPYWNYSAGAPANQLPPAFRQPTWNPGTGEEPNPLYTTARNTSPDINAGAALPTSATSFATAYSYVNFTGTPAPGFGGPQTGFSHEPTAFGALENQPHNIVHVLVGGDSIPPCSSGWMSDPNCAAQDPIFWLHHANIDRLWTNWLALGGGRADPPDTAWRNFTFKFYDENGAEVSMTPADVLDTLTQLHYKYDDHPAVALTCRRLVAAMSSPPPPSRPPRLVAASEGAIELRGPRTDAKLALPPPARDAIQAVTTEGTPGHVYLNVEGLESDKIPGLVYEVHLNLPDDASPGHVDDSLVGYVSFFGFRRDPAAVDDSGVHGLGPMVHTFDITGRVQDLQQRGRWNPEAVTVSFVPVGLEPPPGSKGTAYDATTSAVPRIGRVSISSH